MAACFRRPLFSGMVQTITAGIDEIQHSPVLFSNLFGIDPVFVQKRVIQFRLFVTVPFQEDQIFVVNVVFIPCSCIQAGEEFRDRDIHVFLGNEVKPVKTGSPAISRSSAGRPLRRYGRISSLRPQRTDGTDQQDIVWIRRRLIDHVVPADRDGVNKRIEDEAVPGKRLEFR